MNKPVQRTGLFNYNSRIKQIINCNQINKRGIKKY